MNDIFKIHTIFKLVDSPWAGHGYLRGTWALRFYEGFDWRSRAWVNFKAGTNRFLGNRNFSDPNRELGNFELLYTHSLLEWQWSLAQKWRKQDLVFSVKLQLKQNLYVVLVLLVTWVPRTLNPLKSAKIPLVVYMSNFRLLVHPLLIDFGGGSSCSCSCCDRGKTYSTPSPKTEFWTLDWSLTTEKKIVETNG